MDQNNYYEYFAYTFDHSNLAGGNGTIMSDLSVRFDSDFNYVLNKLSHVGIDNRIYLNFRNESTGRFLSSEKIDLTTISADHNSIGSIVFFKPSALIKPYDILQNTTYTVQMSDYSGNPNALRLLFHGGKKRIGTAPWDKQWSRVEYFVYTSSDISLDANQTKILNLNISTDANFLVHRITGTFNREFLVTFKDAATDRLWSNAPVHSNNIVGSGFYPHNLVHYRFIPLGSAISIELQDISGLPNNISLSFSGMKLYD